MAKKPMPRVREHVDRLREAGLDTQKFFDALVAIRDDSALPRPHREALYKLIASESFIWYVEALRNEQLDRIKLRDDLFKLREEHAAAIRKMPEGGLAGQLAERTTAGQKQEPAEADPAGKQSGAPKPSVPPFGKK